MIRKEAATWAKEEAVVLHKSMGGRSQGDSVELLTRRPAVAGLGEAPEAEKKKRRERALAVEQIQVCSVVGMVAYRRTVLTTNP